MGVNGGEREREKEEEEVVEEGVTLALTTNHC